MNTRVKEVRKSTGLTLEEFGKRLGVTKAAVSNIENGNRNVTDQMVVSLCREFNVNENWLRTGTGEMFRKLNRQQEIAKLTADLFKEEPESFKSRLNMALADLDESEWKVLENLANKILKEKD